METVALRQCPLCQSSNFEELYRGIDRYFSKEPVCYDICRDCGFVFLNPQPTAAKLQRWYRSVFQDKRRGIDTVEAAIERLENKGSYERKKNHLPLFSPYLQQGSQCLEIGGGWGTLAKVLEDTFCCSVDVVEPSALAAQVARTRYGLTVHQEDFFTFAQKAAQQYDMVYLFHVFEHFSDPRQAMAIVRSLVTEGGVVVIAVPDITRPDSPPERFFHVEHAGYYSLATLRFLLETHGFTVVAEHAGATDIKIVARRTALSNAPVAPAGEYNRVREYIAPWLRRARFASPLKRVARSLVPAAWHAPLVRFIKRT